MQIKRMQTVSATKQTATYLRESLWVLYSMTVFGGRFRTRLRVSRMRVVVAVSCAVLFHTEMMSSCHDMGGIFLCPLVTGIRLQNICDDD